MMYIMEEEIKKLAKIGEVFNVVYGAFHDEDTHMIPKSYLSVDKGDFRAMPARDGNIAGIKWVSVHPENPKKGMPTVQGTIILNDANTGEVLCVMDAAYITKLRTAAAAAVATKKLAKKKSKVAAFVGCGAQTELHVHMITHAVPSITKLKFYDISPAKSDDMSLKFSSVFSGSKSYDSVEDCVSGADIVTTLTPSTEPVVEGFYVSDGTHINAMGADAEGKREFDIQLYRNVDIWIYDDEEQASHSGETQHLDLNSMPMMGSLKEVVGRAFENQITLFDSTGLAIQDIAVASYILDKYIEALGPQYGGPD